MLARPENEALHATAVRAAHVARSLALALIAVAAIAPAAAAQHVIVGFDLMAESTFALLGGTLTSPRDGAFTDGFLELEMILPGSGLPGEGTVLMRDLALAGTLDRDVQGQAMVSGSWSFLQTEPIEGVVSQGLDTIDFAGAGLVLDTQVDVGCSGPGCDILGLPIAVDGPMTPYTSVLSAFGLDVPGEARLEVKVPFELDGVLGFVDLVAIESSRTIVPEPGTAMLTALALGLLARRARRLRIA